MHKLTFTIFLPAFFLIDTHCIQLMMRRTYDRSALERIRDESPPSSLVLPAEIRDRINSMNMGKDETAESLLQTEEEEASQSR